MWSTHPGNRDREDNAKRVYVDSELDPRPAWVLFRDAEKLKRDATAKIVAENAPASLRLRHRVAGYPDFEPAGKGRMSV